MASAPAPDDILRPFAPRIRATANTVRRIIARAVPTLSERALPGWKAIGFRDPHAGHLCALFPYDDHVKLYFEHGARLRDPDALLCGDAAQTRYVTWRSTRTVRVRPLVRLLREAVKEQSMLRKRCRS